MQNSIGPINNFDKKKQKIMLAIKNPFFRFYSGNKKIDKNLRKYKIYWSFRKKGKKRRGELWQLFIDYPGSFYRGDFNKKHIATRLIPPYLIVNELFQSGGSDGIMSPGSTWEPFSINEQEYSKLVEDLLSLDTQKLKNKHIYLPDTIIIDNELNSAYSNPAEWKKAWILKYRGVDRLNQFSYDKKYSVLLGDKELGQFEINGRDYQGIHQANWFSMEDQIFELKDYNFKIANEYIISNHQKKGYDWVKPSQKILSKLQVKDEWDRIQNFTEFYLSKSEKNRILIFQTTFQEIPPYLPFQNQ